MKKETAAQRIERIKKEKNGLDVIHDIKLYAQGLKTLDIEDIDRFKWYGLYTQNKNLQDKNDETLYFMLRIKLKNATITIEQLNVLANISKQFARDTAYFTTRQDIQFHFIKIVDLPEIFNRLNTVGLSSIFAAGDVPRNVASCPISGINKNEIYDTSYLANQINDYFKNNRDLSNLPRKYKVSISGCDKHCVGHEIQDLSFTAVKINSKVLFDVQVGGGLASNKKFSLHLGYIKDSQVLDVCKEVTLLYKDLGLREKRTKARLRHLIDEISFDEFKKKLEKKLTFKFILGGASNYTKYIQREHFGLGKSKKENYSYLACYVNGGSIKSYGLFDLYKTFIKFNINLMTLTSSQNFVICDIKNDIADKLINELNSINIDCNPSVFKAKTISCTGMRFCKFAISETKNNAISLVKHLEYKFPDFKEKVSISVNGCPNSCAHPHIVDIGLLGCKIKNNDTTSSSGFELILSGNLEGEKSKFGQKIGMKILESEVNVTVQNLIQEYKNSDFTNLQIFLSNKVKIYNETRISKN